jgi:hypothetical protein
MRFSLVRFRRVLTRIPFARQAVATVIATTLLFALTPCCEVNAAAPDPAHSGQGHHNHGPGHGDDPAEGMPPMSDPCLAWVDNNLNIVDTDMSIPLPERDADPVVFAVLWTTPSPIAATHGAVHSCHSPPSAVPLYLRIERLLI